MSSTFPRQKHVKTRWLVLLLLVGLVAWLVTRDRRPDLDAPAVVAQVQRLNQLATVRYTIQKVVTVEEPKHPVGMERLLLILQANVVAGVDLASLKPEHIRISGDTVSIELPEAKILSAAVDEHATRVWDREKTWWTPWVPYSKDLEGRARAQGLDAARQAALEMGILGQAQRYAEASIISLLSLAGLKVEVKPGTRASS